MSEQEKKVLSNEDMEDVAGGSYIQDFNKKGKVIGGWIVNDKTGVKTYHDRGVFQSQKKFNKEMYKMDNLVNNTIGTIKHK